MPNARIWTSQHSLFAGLAQKPDDPILALISDFRRDPRNGKIDLGVGVYRDETQMTPIMASVKNAERVLLETQSSKSYLGPEGDPAFVACLMPMVLGPSASNDRLVGVQTPGGTGALRLAADLIAEAAPDTRVWLGMPTWPNHAPIFSAAGLAVEAYRYFDQQSQRLLFDGMMQSLKAAKPGDVVVLQACGHNPTGADLDLSQWEEIARLLTNRGLVPLVDLAYQGLALGLEPDRAGLEIVLRHVGEALIAYSCDKNFGLYRERTGALFALGQSQPAAHAVFSNMLASARPNWSMPPDHGAAVVRTILQSDTLKREWMTELETMRRRIFNVRQALSAQSEKLLPLRHQRGMFSLLPLDHSAIARLRMEHAIYMAGSGRINVAGLMTSDIPRFASALEAIGMPEAPS